MQLKLSKADFKLKTSTNNRLWLTIPAGVAFFASIAIFIFCSLPNNQGQGKDYDWNIAVIFGNFYQTAFGSFLAHWAVYTGDKMVFLALVPAIMIIVETYFLKAKTYKPESFLAKNHWLLLVFYSIFFSIFFSLNIWEIWNEKFGDHGWGPGVNVIFVETYETGFIFKIVFFILGFGFYSCATYLIHFRLAKKKLLLKYDYWLPSLKILMFAGLAYATVGITKLAMGRPYYYANIYSNNPDGGLSIEEELRQLLGPNANPTHPTWFELPYMKWWEPYRAPSDWHQLITFNFDMHLYNNDFPSGHITSGAIFLTLIFYGLNQPRKTWKYRATIIFSYLMFIQLTIVYFGMVIHRMHWLSDMAFSVMFIVPYWWFTEIKINSWFEIRFFDKYLPLLSKNDKIRVDVYKTMGSLK